MDTYIILLLVLPIIGSFLYFTGLISSIFKGLLRELFVVALSLFTLAIALIVIFSSIGKPIYTVSWGSMPWIEISAKLFGAIIDPLSMLMLTIVTVLGTFIVLFSTKYLSPENKEHPTERGKVAYYGWLLLFIGSMIGIAISPNLLQFLIFWELTTLCSAALIAFYETEIGYRAGFKALLMTHAPGLFFFITVAIVFVNTKSFEFSAINQLSPTLKITVVVFLLISAWAKSAQIPFYTWIPDAMEAPTPISAYLHAAAMVKAGFYLMARLITSVSGIPFGIGMLIVLMGIATMYLGLIFYFRQDDLKKLLAFSTITHLAYMFFGLGLGVIGSNIAVKGALLHLICHAFGKTILFLCVGVISYLTGTRYISQLSGLSRRMPVVAFAFIVGFLSVTGIPPFSCFWSKFFLVVASIDMKNYLGIIFAVLILGESVGSFIWFLHIAQSVFFGETEKAEEIKIPAVFQFVLISLVILSLIAPFWGFEILKTLR